MASYKGTQKSGAGFVIASIYLCGCSRKLWSGQLSPFTTHKGQPHAIQLAANTAFRPADQLWITNSFSVENVTGPSWGREDLVRTGFSSV